MDTRPLAVIDLDGVLADVRHRLHHISSGTKKNWAAFFAGVGDDDVLVEGRAVVDRLAVDHEIVYLTGRPERTRTATEAWLSEHGLPPGRLLMRADDDRRPARQLKPRLLKSLARGRQVNVVVDDDPAVRKALTEAGWPVLRADWMAEPQPLHQVQETDGRT